MTSIYVFNAKACMDDLASALYEPVFYDSMNGVLANGLWRSFVHDVTGKAYSFSSMDEFLTSNDGLGIQDLGLFQRCMQAVGASGGQIGPMAKTLVENLVGEGMTLIQINAETAPSPLNLSEFDSLFDPNRKPLYVGKSKEWWYKHGQVMTEQSAFVADSSCRGLVGRVMELQRDDYWRQFSDDWGEFCMEAFGRPAEWIEQIVESVRVLHLQEQPVSAADAIELKSHGRLKKDENES